MGQSAAMTPQQYVQDKAAASGSSFYYAFLFLPRPRRAAIRFAFQHNPAACTFSLS